MESNSEPDSPALVLPSPIRVETALSRYPVHRLARKGSIDIDIKEQNAHGEVAIRWEVDYSKKHGQPGPLAYKVDTLIVNRRIEEATRPIPKLIRLGSLRDICRELGMTEGENVNAIRKALRQNAFAGITAKTTYRHSDGTERTLEADFTRYSLILTGEKLPDGRSADAVYILLNEIFMQIINGAMTRPLDYDYLKKLPPAPQRFYELLSYQMYAALKYDRPRAKLVYSDFCAHAPQMRHLAWERVRSQMNKVHRPHRQSGYIAKIDYQQTTDKEGQPDWIMLYMPGPKARMEFKAFAKRGGPNVLEIEPLDAAPPPGLPTISELERGLIERNVTPTIAAELVREHSEEKIRAQMERLDWLIEKKPAKISDPAAYLVGAIQQDYATPKGFVSKAERERRAEAKKQTEQAVEAGRQAGLRQRARDQAERERIARYWDSLSPQDQAALDERAQAAIDPEVKRLAHGPMKRLGEQVTREQLIRQILTELGHLPLPEST